MVKGAIPVNQNNAHKISEIIQRGFDSVINSRKIRKNIIDKKNQKPR